MKRYAIVRVDNKCPKDIEDFKCYFPDISIECMRCHHHRYGDTKKQLIKKVAQVLFRRKIKAYKKVLGFLPKKNLKHMNVRCLEIAKEIVEFLGVEE